GPAILCWTVHYADSTSESAAPATVPDWFLNPAPASQVWNSSGRISMGGALQNIDQAAPAAEIFGIDISASLGSPSVNVTSVDFFFVGGNGNGNTNNNGRVTIFAISGAKDNSTDFTNTIAV